MVRPADLPIANTDADDQGVEGVRVSTSSTSVSSSGADVDLQIEYLPLERLHAAPSNARKHSKMQIKKIANSITRFGFLNPVLISDDLEIIAGHGRVEAAKLLGLQQVPTVRVSKLSAVERRAYIIADNRLAELAAWDREILATELGSLLDLQFNDVEATGFSLDQIELVLEEAGKKQHRDPEDEFQAGLVSPVVSQAGDVWILGQHRLFCGEASHDCDSVVRQWQQYTGKLARLEGSGLTFANAAATRRPEQKRSTVTAQGSE